MNVALIGGSFDPIHKGHLAIASFALKQLHYDEVWFIPTKDTPLKERQLESFFHRKKMCELAIVGQKKLRVCDIEQTFQGKSYTIQTVEELQKRYPKTIFSWIIGSDQAKQLHLWKDIDTLLKKITMVVVSREETAIECSYPVITETMKLYEISSTQIRKGKGMDHVPFRVRSYIGQHYLYLQEMVRAQMSEKRYQHSVRVANLCVRLAKAHGLCLKKAYAMGICHDLCKELPYEKAKRMMEVHFREHIEEPVAVWHGYLGAYVLSEYYRIWDKDVISAVYHHVYGKSYQPYAMILFCSDKLEEGRGYDSSKEIAYCMKDLRKGFIEVKRQQEEYLKKEQDKNGR